MLTADRNRNMQHNSIDFISFSGGSIMAAVNQIAIDETDWSADLPIWAQACVFVLVTFSGGVIGTFGKDFYTRFLKLKGRDGEKLNGPGTSASEAHYRQLRRGLEYDHLIPQAKGNTIIMQEGDTGTSLQIMADTAYSYRSEARQLAEKLKGRTREQTVRNVKDFIYNHFQYLADTDWQLIRTLSRAWRDRKTGIDCKSYSVIASQILLELGIPHYFARIKQIGSPGTPANYNDMWTHVFVIVPKSGEHVDAFDPSTYWALDGVPAYDHVPPFTDIDIFPMLQHAVLNGTSSLGCADAPMVVPKNPIVTAIEPNGVQSGQQVYLVTFAESANPDVDFGVTQLTSNEVGQLCGLGRQFSSRKGLKGLGEPLTIGAIIAMATTAMEFLGPLFSGGEKSRTDELRNKVRNSGWPWLNTTGDPYRYSNHKTAPTPELEQMITRAQNYIQDLQKDVDQGKYSSDGEERVWKRYILVWSEFLKDMAETYQSRMNQSQPGSNHSSTTNIPNIPSSFPKINTGGSATVSANTNSATNSNKSDDDSSGPSMAGFGNSLLTYLLIGGAAFGAYQLIKDQKEEGGETKKKASPKKKESEKVKV
ncbi:hypothetical protein [Phaeocystidibacter marisrubri]|uniref:Transglutaminase domain-containing protein n=1 Tax=Phaeocystidibacter marisrubri TaxID=1577780 RepID=A0A6L3ZCU8_9FLAO|nr:hypothetical protein [Phaeocystidibacter marisrubri]KAB2815029.1 hypothetical protein F8C82_14550 [Phaeocystidibacter marisrubri]GGH78110.1 hypothetical protein GCM10011318_28840 [Phaeocystidibacter marisrubri]